MGPYNWVERPSAPNLAEEGALVLTLLIGYFSNFRQNGIIIKYKGVVTALQIGFRLKNSGFQTTGDTIAFGKHQLGSA